MSLPCSLKKNQSVSQCLFACPVVRLCVSMSVGPSTAPFIFICPSISFILSATNKPYCPIFLLKYKSNFSCLTPQSMMTNTERGETQPLAAKFDVTHSLSDCLQPMEVIVLTEPVAEKGILVRLVISSIPRYHSCTVLLYSATNID